jgi:hypothetical protein
LQAVTDGMGNASPLQLSTTNVAMLAATFFGASSATTNILTLQSTTRNQLKVESGSTLEFWRSAGVESARFDANGNFLIGTTSASARLQVRGDGTNPIALFEGSGTVGNLVCFGGTTNAFPALKRNGAAIDFRLSDDSGYASITASKLILPNTTTGTGLTMGQAVNNSSNFINSGTGGGWLFYLTTGSNEYSASNIRMTVGDTGIVAGNNSMTSDCNASASLEVRSLDRGFLPPRMTTTQVNAITSPAEGLVIYSTTENALCLYNGSSWRKLNDSPL